MDKTFIAVVCGATASGKTRLAVDLARELDGEVISADSMQLYTGMSIATAKPTAEEMCGIPHYLMDFLPPEKAFSVADWLVEARQLIAEITARGKLPIICGGTGLYISSLVDNVEFDDTESDMAFREEMRAIAAEKGNGELLSRLREVDPETASELHENNQSRIIRALEYYRLSGKKLSAAKLESRKNPSPYEPCMMMIDYPDRSVLYERIDRRVDEMLGQGLLEEARRYYDKALPTAAQAIGYKELRPYFDGPCSLEECVERLKLETRHYAKRQLTWFRRDSRINRITAQFDTPYCEILKNAENLIKTYRKNLDVVL